MGVEVSQRAGSRVGLRMGDQRIVIHKPHPDPDAGRATVRLISRFLGEVINAGPYPIVSFEAADVSGLKREFRISIEEYLAWCREDGAEPQRPYSGKLNLRLGAELHQRVATSAARSGMSINSWIKEALDKQAETISTG